MGSPILMVGCSVRVNPIKAEAKISPSLYWKHVLQHCHAPKKFGSCPAKLAQLWLGIAEFFHFSLFVFDLDFSHQRVHGCLGHLSDKSTEEHKSDVTLEESSLPLEGSAETFTPFSSPLLWVFPSPLLFVQLCYE